MVGKSEAQTRKHAEGGEGNRKVKRNNHAAAHSSKTVKGLSDSEAHLKAMQLVNRLKELSSFSLSSHGNTSAKHAFHNLTLTSAKSPTGSGNQNVNSRTGMSEETLAKRCQEFVQGLCVLTRHSGAKFYILNSTCKMMQGLFTAFCKYPKALQALCDLIWSLAYHDKNSQSVFSESGVTEIIIICAKCYGKNVSLLKSAFGALSSLCRHKTNQKIAKRENCMEMVVDILAANGHGDSVLTQYALDAAASLTHGNPDNADAIFSLQGIPLIIKVIKNNINCTGVVRSASILLVVLRERPGASKEIVSSGTVPVLLSACKAHLQVQELQHILCALLGQLARENSAVSSQITANNSVTTLFQIMAAFPKHWLIVEACSLLIAGADIKDACESTTREIDSCYWNKIAHIDTDWTGFNAVLTEHDDRLGLLVTLLRAFKCVFKGQDSVRRFSSLGIPTNLYSSVNRIYTKCIQVGLKKESFSQKLESQLIPAIIELFKSSAFKLHSTVAEVLVSSRINDGGCINAIHSVWDDHLLQSSIPNIRTTIESWEALNKLDENEVVNAVLGIQRLFNCQWFKNKISPSKVKFESILSLGNNTQEEVDGKKIENILQRKITNSDLIYETESALIIIRTIFTHLSMFLLDANTSSKSRNISLEEISKASNETIWVDCLSEALSFLRIFKNWFETNKRGVDWFKISHLIPVTAALLRFVASSLHKKRQLSLRVMASNGGVTLILQIQKYCKQQLAKQSEKSRQLFWSNNEIDPSLPGILETIVKVLKLIGSGDCPILSERLSIEEVLTSYVRVSENKRKLKQEQESIQEKLTNLVINSEETESSIDKSAEEEEESKEESVESNIENSCDDSFSDRENSTTIDDGFSDTSSEGSASVNLLNDNSRVEIDGACEEADPAEDNEKPKPVAEVLYGERTLSPAELSRDDSEPERNTNKTSVESSNKLKLAKMLPTQGVDEIETPLYLFRRFRDKYKRSSNDATPSFVLETPVSMDDLPTLSEPYTPEADQIDAATAFATTMSLSIRACSEKTLVYDWSLAGGEGKNRAKSSIPPALPYTVDRSATLQKMSYGMSPLLSDQASTNHKPTDSIEENHFLHFESRFECGNLLQAVRVGLFEYDLILRSDIHTQAHHQWFYFGVSNTHPEAEKGHVSYTFNIVNLTKPSSMFSHGMRPAHYSYDRAKSRKIGWRRNGDRIAYYANPYQIPNKKSTGNANPNSYYTLTFRMTFTKPGDKHLIAMAYPYSYSCLNRYLDSKCSIPHVSQFVRRELLCNTLGGLRCDLLTITDFTATTQDIAKREVVVFTGRVHPGETNASYMMEGTIQFLLGRSTIARLLRENFVFKIVPMLNPDGVYHGNTRCSLHGVDLNRAWVSPQPDAHPTIWHAKQMIRHLVATRKVALYVDFHGHSRKKNIFMYGVENRRISKVNASALSSKVREYPRLVSQSPHSSHIFSFPDCSFHVHKGHESAARVVVAREFGIKTSYTLEASFCGGGPGTKNESLQNSHYSKKNLREIGVGLCDALLQMQCPKIHSFAVTSYPQTLGTADISDASYEKFMNALEEPAKFAQSNSSSESPSSSRLRNQFRSKCKKTKQDSWKETTTLVGSEKFSIPLIEGQSSNELKKSSDKKALIKMKSSVVKHTDNNNKAELISRKSKHNKKEKHEGSVVSVTAAANTSNSNVESNSKTKKVVRRRLRSQRQNRNHAQKSSTSEDGMERPYTTSFQVTDTGGKGLLWSLNSPSTNKTNNTMAVKDVKMVDKAITLSSKTKKHKVNSKRTKRFKGKKGKKSKSSNGSELSSSYKTEFSKGKQIKGIAFRKSSSNSVLSSQHESSCLPSIDTFSRVLCTRE